MRWESLVSCSNLRLAWRRINTGNNPQYKRFFRDIYLVYEAALERNLKSLNQQLLAHAWTPSYPQRVYIPKASGLQRPISLLGIEDQILLQAVANVFAGRLRRRRKTVELRTVFSNILSHPANSIFLTQPWRQTYYRFQSRCRALFREGNRCFAEFDLVAYYDTISHDMLLRIVSPRSDHPDTWAEVGKWLVTWSSPSAASSTAHGIPQGPVASNLLAEAFFLPIDRKLIEKGIKYVRYVDDIRLLGKTEIEVQKAVVSLERLCRDRGLIPKAIASSRAERSEEVLGSLPSIPPGETDGIPEQMEESEALDILETCVDGRPLRVTNRSRFRYLMHRAPKSPKILGKVTRLLPRHPEHIDDFTAYLANYDRSTKAVNGIAQALQVGVPYAYVRGELWHVLARLGTREHLEELLPAALQEARERNECLALSWGTMAFLVRCEEEGLCRAGGRLGRETPMSRALLASKIPAREFAPGRVISNMLKGTLEEQLAASRELQARGISLSQLGLRQRALPEVCQHTLRELGVIRRTNYAARDWIAERLHRRHGGTVIRIWRSLLGKDYEHALQILINADKSFDIAPSVWLGYQDSFSDAAVRAFITHLRSRGLPGGGQLTVGKDGRLVKYGALLAPGGPLGRAFPSVTSRLLSAHERRNKLPGSHPYDHRGGTQNRLLSRRERDSLHSGIGNALVELATYVHSTP